MAVNTIPEWPSLCTKASRVYRGCKYLNAVWKEEATTEELMPPLITEHEDAVLGTDAALRAKFTQSWGGTAAS